MTKSKTFRLNTIDRAELKVLSKFYNCNETDVIKIALQSLATRFITDEELNKAIEDITTSEYRRDKCAD